MTYKEALASGYKNGDVVLQRGYVSRKADVGEQEVLFAKGTRSGQAYVLLPNRKSTQYCFRQYLIKEEE